MRVPSRDTIGLMGVLAFVIAGYTLLFVFHPQQARQAVEGLAHVFRIVVYFVSQIGQIFRHIP